MLYYRAANGVAVKIKAQVNRLVGPDFTLTYVLFFIKGKTEFIAAVLVGYAIIQL